MDHEGGRIGARRMGEAQLGRATARDRRRIGFHRDFQRPVHLRRAQDDGGRVVGAVDGAEQLAQPGSMQRADAHGFGPGHERKLALQQRLGLVALVAVQPVPFVDRDHQRPPGVEHGAQHAGVLVGDAFAGIEHDHRHLALFDRLQGLDDRELLDRFFHPRLAPDAGRIHQAVLAAFALHVHGDGIAGGPGNVGSNHALLAQEPVHQRGLAHVGPANEGQADALGVVIQVLALACFRQLRQDPRQQRVNALAMGGGDGEAVLEAVAGEVRE